MAKIPRRDLTPPQQRRQLRREEEAATLKQKMAEKRRRETPLDNALKKWVGHIDTSGS